MKYIKRPAGLKKYPLFGIIYGLTQFQHLNSVLISFQCERGRCSRCCCYGVSFLGCNLGEVAVVESPGGKGFILLFLMYVVCLFNVCLSHQTETFVMASNVQLYSPFILRTQQNAWHSVGTQNVCEYMNKSYFGRGLLLCYFDTILICIKFKKLKKNTNSCNFSLHSTPQFLISQMYGSQSCVYVLKLSWRFLTGLH